METNDGDVPTHEVHDETYESPSVTFTREVSQRKGGWEERKRKKERKIGIRKYLVVGTWFESWSVTLGVCLARRTTSSSRTRGPPSLVGYMSL